MHASGGLFDLDALNERIAENEHRMTDPNFWNDNETAQKVINENNDLKAKRDTNVHLKEQLENLQTTIELLSEDTDDELQSEFELDYAATQKELQEYRLTQLLDGPYDDKNAILEIHPGAGGTEAQDWGAMLLRMYVRWAERHGFSYKVTDYLDGEEAGIKSATIIIEGENAYGYMKSESGIHRLVRVSPFDASGRRHTSFAAVEVMPQAVVPVTW